MQQIIDDLLTHRYGSPNRKPQQPDATADQTSNMSDLTRDIYMRHFKSQVEAKLRSRDFPVRFVPEQQAQSEYYVFDDVNDAPFYPSLAGRQRLVPAKPAIAAHYALIKNKGDSYHEIIQKGYFMKGMESFVVHAANISIYVEIEFQPPVNMTEIPAIIPDDTIVVLHMELLCSNGNFVEDTHIQFKKFKTDVEDEIIQSIQGITNLYILAESGLNMNRF